MSKAWLSLVGIAAFIGWSYYRDTSRFNALSPAEQYEEHCKQDWRAPSVAASSLRERLNIVDTPKFEVSDVGKIVRSERNAANDCLFTVEGRITFKNESGGQSRRMARVVLGPKRGDTANWFVFAVDVW